MSKSSKLSSSITIKNMPSAGQTKDSEGCCPTTEEVSRSLMLSQLAGLSLESAEEIASVKDEGLVSSIPDSIAKSDSGSLPDVVGTPTVRSASTSLSQQDVPSEGISCKGSPEVSPSIDESIRAAFDQPRTRLFVLRVEQKLLEFIKQSSLDEFDLAAGNPYERLLTHKVADYFQVQHVTDTSQTGVKVFKTPKTYIPIATVTDAVGIKAIPTPSVGLLKIMRRNLSSETGSEIGDGTDPSNMSVRSEDSGTSSIQRPLTIEEKTASYEAARARIFADFTELSIDKKPKDKVRNRLDDDFSARSKFKLVRTPVCSPTGYQQPYHAAYLEDPPLQAQPARMHRSTSATSAEVAGVGFSQSDQVVYPGPHLNPSVSGYSPSPFVSPSVSPDNRSQNGSPFGYQVPLLGPTGPSNLSQVRGQQGLVTVQPTYSAPPQGYLPHIHYPTHTTPYVVSPPIYTGSESYFPVQRSFTSNPTGFRPKSQPQPINYGVMEPSPYGYSYDMRGQPVRMNMSMGHAHGQYSHQNQNINHVHREMPRHPAFATQYMVPPMRMPMPYNSNNLPKPPLMPIQNGSIIAPKVTNKAFVKAPVGVEVDGVMYYDRNQQKLFEATFGTASSPSATQQIT